MKVNVLKGDLDIEVYDRADKQVPVRGAYTTAGNTLVVQLGQDMINILELEGVLHELLREKREVPEDLVIHLAQELGPKIADFLHAKGVDIDWPDRSRFTR